MNSTSARTPSGYARFEMAKGMEQHKEPDPKNPREKQPAVSRDAREGEKIGKLAKGQDPFGEKSKKAADDHEDVRKKIKEKFSSPKQLP
jgi:hypothetical protein